VDVLIAESWKLSGLETGLLYVSLGVYLGASVVAWRVLTGQRRGAPLPSMLGVGLIVLTLLVGAMTLRQGGLPIARRFEVLTVAAWMLALGAWVVVRWTDLKVLGAVSAPTLALLLFFALLLEPSASAGALDARTGKVTHILLAILGFSAFAFAAGVGALYLWQIRVVRHNPTAAVSRRMPPLEVLDRLNFMAAAFGFPTLALSVVGATLFLARDLDAGWWLDPTVLATLAGLAVYVVLFGARAFLGWYGRRIAWLTVIGFLVIVLGYVVGAYCTGSNVIHGA